MRNTSRNVLQQLGIAFGAWTAVAAVAYACIPLQALAQGRALPPLRGVLEERLDPRQFARVHRSAIVNVARVQALRPATHGQRDVLLRDGTQLKLSRMYPDRLAELLSRGPWTIALSPAHCFG